MPKFPLPPELRQLVEKLAGLMSRGGGEAGRIAPEITELPRYSIKKQNGWMLGSSVNPVETDRSLGALVTNQDELIRWLFKQRQEGNVGPAGISNDPHSFGGWLAGQVQDVISGQHMKNLERAVDSPEVGGLGDLYRDAIKMKPNENLGMHFDPVTGEYVPNPKSQHYVPPIRIR